MIPHLLLSFLSTVASSDDMRRLVEVSDRWEHRLPDDGTEYGKLVIDALNAIDLAWRGYVSRLEGSIDYALRCERQVDRILSEYGY